MYHIPLIRAKYLEGQDREHFIVLLLDTKHRINAIHPATSPQAPRTSP